MAYSQYGDNKPMSVGDWFFTILILAIPFVNIIMYIVWAMGGTSNVNRRNFCRASILWFSIIFGFVILIQLFVGL